MPPLLFFPAENLQVVFDTRDMLQLHSPVQAFEQLRAPVDVEILASVFLQIARDLSQQRFCPFIEPAVRVRSRQLGAGVAELEYLVRHEAQRQHEIDAPGCDRAARHAVVLGFVRILHDREASALTDVAQADRSVRACTCQHDANGSSIVRACQCAQEMIDGRALIAALFQLRKPQMRVDRVQIGIRGYDIDVVRLEGHGGVHLRHRHRRGGLQSLRQVTFVVR